MLHDTAREVAYRCPMLTAKFQVMNSHTGFRPANAEPTAMPQKPACHHHACNVKAISRSMPHTDAAACTCMRAVA